MCDKGNTIETRVIGNERKQIGYLILKNCLQLENDSKDA